MTLIVLYRHNKSTMIVVFGGGYLFGEMSPKFQGWLFGKGGGKNTKTYK